MFAATDIPVGDYVSPNFQVIMPDSNFPNMTIGDTSTQSWQYLRREIPHNWYVDRRQPYVGFLSRDEAHILYNTALQFAGKPALEIGCWLGWSACHLALAGVNLDVVDPLLGREEFYGSVTNSLTEAGVIDRVNLVPGFSPAQVTELFQKKKHQQWSLIFIDGNHDAPGPLEDAIACADYAAPDALILFHDLAAPDVAQGLDFLKSQGWHTMIYQTMQIMGVAWRGNVQPIQHIPDPNIEWHLPVHLQHYQVSGANNLDLQEYQELLIKVRPFTLLSEMRLYALYTAAKQICLQDLPGNFVECGAYKGGASAMMAAVIKRYSQRPRKLFAFDTFSGMPEPTDCDRQVGNSAKDAGFGAGTLSAPIAENIDKIAEQLDVKDILEVVPGLFKDTLPIYHAQIGEIALLHADGDWYESTLDIFNNLYDAVVTNGIIQIDDYGCWEGCRLAIQDFVKERNLRFELELIDYSGVSFVKQSQVLETPLQLEPQVNWQPNKYLQGYEVSNLSTLESATTSYIKSAPVLAKILQLMSENQLVDAMYLTEYLTKLDVNIAGANYLKAICFYDLGRHKESLAAARKELEVNPHHGKSQEIVNNLSRTFTKPQIETAWSDRPWATSLPRETLLFIQQASMGYSYRGVPMIKNPFDFALYPLLLWQIKPRTIIEIGSKEGGSALWFGDQVNNFGLDCHIYSVDIVKVDEVSHPRVTFLQGNGRDLGKTFSDEFMQGLPRPLLVIEDADHAYETSKAVLEFFDPYLEIDEYIIIEDGIISDLVQDPNYNVGPHRALKEFLAVYGAAYVIDQQYCDYFGYNLTWCTNGFLKKVATQVRSPLDDLDYELRDINILVCPDWKQSEENLRAELSEAIAKIIAHPQSGNISLLVDITGTNEEDATLVFSGVLIDLLMQEELVNHGEPDVNFVGDLDPSQWQELLSHINYHLPLSSESDTFKMITKIGSPQIIVLE